MSFKPGDLVMVIEQGIPETNMVGAIKSECHCFQALAVAIRRGLSIYQITCSDKCFVESSLRRIGGEPEQRETRIDEEVVA